MLKDYIKKHQQKIVLLFAFLLVAAISFGIGRATAFKYSLPEIRVEEAFLTPINYSQNISGAQTPASAGASRCDGQIKGSSSMIYHLPGGAFYDRTTNPIRCFNTEAEAVSAGFRKAVR
jgi:hypothetical protein